VLPIGGTQAINALNLTIPGASTTTYIVGAPQLTFTYAGTGVSRHVYAQLVDDTTGLVLGNQVTPIPVTLDGQTHTVTIPLEMVAATLNPGETVTLQLVASAASYETIWSIGELNVSNIALSLPTADAAAVSPESIAMMTVA
jgi:ABC-2 type transport system ATP-binding protein